MSQRRMLEVEIDVLDKNNDRLAERNRAFAAAGNWCSTWFPACSSGKYPADGNLMRPERQRSVRAVIEGDQQAVNDAARISLHRHTNRFDETPVKAAILTHR